MGERGEGPGVYPIVVFGSGLLSIRFSAERSGFRFVLECDGEVHESILVAFAPIAPRRLLQDLIAFDRLLSRRREHATRWGKDAFTYVRFRDYTGAIKLLVNHDLLSTDEPEFICLVKVDEGEGSWRGTSFVVEAGFSADSRLALEEL